MNIDFSRRLRVAEDTLIRELDGESVLLSLKTQKYYGLDPVGARMWRVMTTSDSIHAAYEQLLQEYDVEADKLRQDMAELISRLLEQELLEFAGD